jgi:hypothetical protein
MGLGMGARLRRRAPTRWALPAVVTLLAVAPAAAQAPRERSDVERIIAGVHDEDRVQRALGAVAVQHLVRGQWNFSLFGRTSPRWWQRELAPAVPRLVDMLGDERGLEWVDGNGNTERVTTPRKEATLALVALERAAVGPLIDVLDRPALARKADELLRRITAAAPVSADKPGWQRWWAEHQGRPLPRERGQLGNAALVALLIAGAVALVIWQQRKRAGAPAAALPRHPLAPRDVAPEPQQGGGVHDDEGARQAAQPPGALAGDGKQVEQRLPAEDPEPQQPR